MFHEGRFVPGTRTRLLMLLGALVLGWIAVRSAMQRSFEYDQPQLAAQVWPAGGTSLASLARLRVEAAGADVDDETRALYRSALAREPLLSDPLALAALDAAGTGDDARAERLMIAARERDPRSPLARLWLFDHYVRTAQYSPALDEVGPVVRLQPDAITAVMTVLAALSSTPEGNAALAQKLAARPFWRTEFFQVAAKTAPARALLELLSALPAIPDRAAAEQDQRAVLLALVNAGDGALAYSTWQQSLPASYRPRATGIYDGNFSQWPGAAPFNWILNQDAVGTANMVTAGDLPESTALDVRYFGSTSGMLAEQYVFASPGSYRLQLSARRRTSGATGGRLNMEVRCTTGPMVGTLPLEPLGAQLRTLSMPLQVPGECGLLRVRLVGTPGEVFSEIEAQITGVMLVPGG